METLERFIKMLKSLMDEKFTGVVSFQLTLNQGGIRDAKINKEFRLK